MDDYQNSISLPEICQRRLSPHQLITLGLTARFLRAEWINAWKEVGEDKKEEK